MTNETIITDQHGDKLTISTGQRSARGDQVTVHVKETHRGRVHSGAVHVTPAELRAALGKVVVAGSYTRTAPDPDDMDGGVTAAAIEKEAEGLTAADFAQAEFARHPDGRTACSKLPHNGLPWTVSDGEMWGSGALARDGWSPVRECPDPDGHVLARDYAAMSDRATQWQERAEKAEQERDEERSEADSLFRQLEATEASLREANEVAKSLRAAEPRPLNAREHLEAAWEASHVPEDRKIPAGTPIITRVRDTGQIFSGLSKGYGDTYWAERRLLDPPVPTRHPEAERIEDLLSICDDMPRDRKADFLASRGVRVEGSGS